MQAIGLSGAARGRRTPGRARRGAHRRSRRVLAAEADAVLFVVYEHVHDAGEGQRDGPVLGGQLVPAVGSERVAQLRQLLGANARAEHLAAVEPDADLLWLVVAGHS